MDDEINPRSPTVEPLQTAAAWPFGSWDASSYREVPGFPAPLASASPVWAAQGLALTAVI